MPRSILWTLMKMVLMASSGCCQYSAALMGGILEQEVLSLIKVPLCSGILNKLQTPMLSTYSRMLQICMLLPLLESLIFFISKT